MAVTNYEHVHKALNIGGKWTDTFHVPLRGSGYTQDLGGLESHLESSLIPKHRRIRPQVPSASFNSQLSTFNLSSLQYIPNMVDLLQPASAEVDFHEVETAGSFLRPRFLNV